MNKRIVVLGCQRSGTNFVASCIAKDNNLPLYNERELGYSSCSITFGSHATLIEFMNNTDEFVLQAPSLNAYCDLVNDWLDEPVYFYWVDRDAEEIRDSRDRVKWSGEEKEMAKFNERFGNLLKDTKPEDSVDAAMTCFVYQMTKIPCTIVNYNDYKEHQLYIDKRKGFKIGQTV